MESLMLPGAPMSRLAESLGLNETTKAALNAAAKQTAINTVAAGRILDAFSPLAQKSVGALALQRFVSAGYLTRPLAHYAAHFVNSRQLDALLMQKHTNTMLQRCMLNTAHNNAFIQNLMAALHSSGINLPGVDPNASIDVQLSQIMQGVINHFNQAIQQKLNEMFPPPAVGGKKRKKKGGIKGKLKKGLKKFKKVAKSVGKIGKGMFKGVVGGVKGLFKGNLLKGIFKLGTGLLGGLIGGPVGSSMLGQVAQIGIGKLLGKKKAAKLNQVFGQMNNMFSVVANIQKMNSLPKNGLSGFLRA